MIFFQDNQYPRIASFIRDELPRTKTTNPRAYLAFLTVCGDGDLARQALSPGRYPVIAVWPFTVHGKPARNIGGVFDDCPPGDRTNMVALNTHRVGHYEKDPSGARETLERTILHEMVHWARHHAGLPDLVFGHEAGNVFEVLGYKNATFTDHAPQSCPEGRGDFNYSLLFNH